jgi:plastocyanin
MQRSARSRPAVRALIGALVLAAPFGLSACSVKEREADQIAGKQAFVKKCGSCHVLNRAGTKGLTGPDLDAAFRQGLADGLGTDGVRGVVRQQIAIPSMAGVKGAGIMPADLAKGDEADDIADYVAAVVSKSGKDAGLLGAAVKEAGAGKPIAAKGDTLTIPADPSGALLYVSKIATAKAGSLKLVMPNESGVPHNLVIDAKGETKVIEQGSTDFSASFEGGEYEYYCSVPGHRAAGMEGKLTVK